MADTLQLNAQPRTIVGRKVRQLRARGIVPVVVYGNVDAPENLQVSAQSLERTLQQGGTSQLIEVDVEGSHKHNVLVRDIQRHPVRHSLMHADFYAIDMREKQQVTVPIIGINRPETVPIGFMLLQALESVDIEALPAAIPASIEVDVGDLDMEDTITVADLPVPEGVEFLTEMDEPVFTYVVTREEEELEELEEAVDVDEMEEPEVVGQEEDEEAEFEEEEG